MNIEKDNMEEERDVIMVANGILSEVCEVFSEENKRLSKWFDYLSHKHMVTLNKIKKDIEENNKKLYHIMDTYEITTNNVSFEDIFFLFQKVDEFAKSIEDCIRTELKNIEGTEITEISNKSNLDMKEKDVLPNLPLDMNPIINNPNENCGFCKDWKALVAENGRLSEYFKALVEENEALIVQWYRLKDLTYKYQLKLIMIYHQENMNRLKNTITRALNNKRLSYTIRSNLETNTERLIDYIKNTRMLEVYSQSRHWLRTIAQNKNTRINKRPRTMKGNSSIFTLEPKNSISKLKIKSKSLGRKRQLFKFN